VAQSDAPHDAANDDADGSSGIGSDSDGEASGSERPAKVQRVTGFIKPSISIVEARLGPGSTARRARSSASDVQAVASSTAQQHSRSVLALC
jgi:hypothetical protein